MASLTKKDILELTREAFGSTVLSHLNEAQSIKFYKSLKTFLDSGVQYPYGELLRLVQSWKVCNDKATPKYLKMAVRDAARKLFGGLRELRAEREKKLPPELRSKPVKPKEKQEQVAEPIDRQALIDKFDPLQETIASVVAFRQEFEHWSKVAKAAGIELPGVAKAGNLWRESIKDALELFRSLKLIDEGAIEKMRQQISIGTIQVLINQGVPNPQQTGGLLERFLGEVGAIAIEAGTQEIQNASEFRTANGESGSSDTIIVEVGEGREDKPVGIELDRVLPSEPSTRDDEPNPA